MHTTFIKPMRLNYAVAQEQSMCLINMVYRETSTGANFCETPPDTPEQSFVIFTFVPSSVEKPHPQRRYTCAAA